MNDKKFLATSLKKSFEQPNLKGPYLDMFAIYFDSDSFTYISNKKTPYLLPWIPPHKFTRKYLHALHHDAFRSRDIQQSFQTLKHYMTENVIMPEDFPNAEQIAATLQIKSLDRSSAQKKFLTSFLAPPNYPISMQTNSAYLTQMLEKIMNLAKQDKDSYIIALLKNFIATYQRIRQQKFFTRILLYLNQKKIRNYLRNYWENIKNRERTDSAEIFKLRLKGSGIFFIKSNVREIRRLLLSLTLKLTYFANYPETFHLIDSLITDPIKYHHSFQEFCRQRLAPNSEDIYHLINIVESLQNDYIAMCYLMGTLSVFENKFLDQITLESRPEIPTVDPQKELRQIKKIIAQSSLNTTVKTKTAKLLSSLLNEFAQKSTQANADWQRYIGPDLKI